MLNLKYFVDGTESLLYDTGDRHYWIYQTGNHFTLDVHTMDEGGEISKQVFSCSSVSSAIAQIEEMEGKTV